MQSRSTRNCTREFHEPGGEFLLLDEIHKYSDWASHIKSMYESLPELRIVFSGSSLLQISKEKADLIRRAIIFNLHGLSLREYINLNSRRKCNHGRHKSMKKRGLCANNPLFLP
ncbi:ATP-binding protein [Chlorobium limicola]|uniref:ATP-binding protein n=1 Tax=Chlorobium limicola TaxID=1092 RepID=UPI0009D718B9